MESRIQRSFFDLKQIMRSSFDVLYERIAVQELSLQHSENHNLQGTRKEVSPYRLFHADAFFSLFGRPSSSRPRAKWYKGGRSQVK